MAPENGGVPRLQRCIVGQLVSLQRGLGSYLDGFTPQQFIWCSVSGQPSVGRILCHIAKFADLLAQTTIP
jgi:hypothetical protein